MEDAAQVLPQGNKVGLNPEMGEEVVSWGEPDCGWFGGLAERTDRDEKYRKSDRVFAKETPSHASHLHIAFAIKMAGEEDTPTAIPQHSSPRAPRCAIPS